MAIVGGDMVKRVGNGLYQFHLINILFLFAIVTGEDAVGDMEISRHRFVVGNTLWIVAFYNAFNLIGCTYRFFLYYFVVTDDIEHNIRCYDRQP